MLLLVLCPGTPGGSTGNGSGFKDICGYFQCAPFPRLQTGKVVFRPLTDSDQYSFRYSYVISVFRHFLHKITN